MGMLDRYKKKGGFIQLLNLIETTASPKAEKFLKMIGEESPAWESEIKKKVISMDRLATWNQSYLMEIFPRLTPAVISTAICQLPPEKQQIFLGALPFVERRKTEDLMKEHQHNAGEVASCQTKLLTEVRTMVGLGLLKFEKIDPDLVVPENIEDVLNSGGTNSFVTAAFESEATGSHAIPAHATPAAAHAAPAAPHGNVAPSAHGSTPAQSATAPAAAPTAAPNSDELLQLRRRVMALTQENQTLKTQLQGFKEKLDQIRKFAS